MDPSTVSPRDRSPSQHQIKDRTRQGKAEERAEALEHLDFAIGEFRDMKMQPSLERALSHRDILKA